jgi:tight adherence protein B
MIFDPGLLEVRLAIFVAAATCSAVFAWIILTVVPAARERFERRVLKASRDRLVVVDPTHLWRIQWAGAVTAALVAAGWGGSLPGVIVAGVVALILPRLFIARLRQRRLHQLRRQLPDFLVLVAGSLRAGGGLVLALSNAAAASPSPSRQQIELMLADVRLGTSLSDAMSALERRAPIEELTLIGTAMRVGLESGGSLAEVLDSLASSMRRRLALEDRIRALTAQGRLQALIMALLPALIVALLAWVDRPSFDELVTTSSGQWLLCAVAVCQLVGFRLVRRIVDIEV